MGVGTFDSRAPVRRGVLLSLLAALWFSAWWPVEAHAWWNSEWAYRKRIVLHAAAGGTEANGPVEGAVVAVRLHSGNFPFVDAREGGEDLRFVAGDDKTPLPFHFEVFDGINGIAVAWVQVPRLAQSTSGDEIWLYYGNPDAPSAASAASTFDAATLAAYHFGRRETAPIDASASALHAATSGASSIPEGAVDFALSFRPQDAVAIPASPALRVAAGASFTISGWLRLSDQPAEARLITFGGVDGEIALTIRGTNLVARARSAAESPLESVAADRLTQGVWHHFAYTVADRATLYVDGVEAGSVPATLPALDGPITIGAIEGIPGFAGDLDELQFAKVARGAGWIRVAALGQGPDGRVVELGPDEAQASGGQYLTLLRVLAGAVSRDAWVIIGLIAILGFLSAETIVVKAGLLRRAERANRQFLERFRRSGGDFASMDDTDRADPSSGQADTVPATMADSSLYRMHRVAVDELRRLKSGNAAATSGDAGPVGAAEINVLRASLDSVMVEEVERLNRRMVLLTLSVSGAPFLGLLGTVVGIMITFATIALQGDVNVNTIAPGVAAAITTTVAGLVVAIPVMFAYNFLTLRIRSITTAMELFNNELLGRIAQARR